MLVGNETSEDYREATAKEKADWDAAHPDGNTVPQRPAWADLAEAAGAVRNDRTGYWSLNGLDDLTDEEMEVIYTYKQVMPYPISIATTGQRTNMIITNTVSGWDRRPNLRALFRGNDLCVIKLGEPNLQFGVAAVSVNNMIAINSSKNKLEEIIGTVTLRYVDDPAPLMPFSTQNVLFPKLTTFEFIQLNKSLYLGNLPVLSYDSLKKIVDTAINTEPISITVHPDVYAKLTAKSGLVNLVKGSNNELANLKYALGAYHYDSLEHMVHGQKYRLTVCYELGEKDDTFVGSIVAGYGGSTTDGRFTTRGAKVIESKIVTFDTSHLPSNIKPNLTFYRLPNDNDFDPSTKLYWAVLTPLMDDEASEWVPSVSEIEDAADRESANWLLLKQLAAARQISFVEATI